MTKIIMFPGNREAVRRNADGVCPPAEANPYGGDLDSVKRFQFNGRISKAQEALGESTNIELWNKIYDELQAGNERGATLLLRRSVNGLDLATSRDMIKELGQTLQSINDADWSRMMAAGKDAKCAQAFFSLAEPVWREYDLTDEIKWEVYCMLYDRQLTYAIWILLRSVYGKPEHSLRKSRETAEVLADIMEGLR